MKANPNSKSPTSVNPIAQTDGAPQGPSPAALALRSELERKKDHARKTDLYCALRGVKGALEEDSEGTFLSAYDRLKRFDCKDPAEEMLAETMILVHSAQMSSIRDAHDAGLGSPIGAIHLANFLRLNDAYLEQMKVLDKHRGKASQKVVVERVVVKEGGQAVIGDVDARSRAVDCPNCTPRKHPANV